MKTELLFDGKPLDNVELVRKLFDVMGGNSSELEQEFKTAAPTGMVLGAMNIAFTFNSVAAGNQFSGAISWSLLSHVLLLIAQGRLKINAIPDENPLNVEDVIAEALRIINADRGPSLP